jgi:formate hydrogenlyase regulatory protein HycA
LENIVAVPSKIKVKRIPDYYTKTIGKYEQGQFMALITATLPNPIPKNWEEQKRWYAVLHTFTAEGNHVKTEAMFAGTESDGESNYMTRAREMRDEMVNALKSHQFCDVEIGLFSVQVDGFTFGLVDASNPEDNYDSVHLLPNDFAFFKPWDGSFDV